MIEIIKLTKTYLSKEHKVNALDNISMNIGRGDFIVIRGSSGSGKTTLLLTLGAMLKPTNGNILFENEDIYSTNGKERNKFRAENIGFVFQMFHLLPYLTLLENVTVPTFGNQKTEAEKMLNELGLGDRINHKPYALSAGEKQRTAVARALMNNPRIILADEPTGNLDPENTMEVINSLLKYQKNGGTVVIVTHGMEADEFADRIIILKNGRIIENEKSKSKENK